MISKAGTLTLKSKIISAEAPPTERHMPKVGGRNFIGAPNFRDFGGYVAANGRRVRRDHLYRADAFSSLTEGDLKMLSTLGIRLVCDFRDGSERSKKPSRWPLGSETDFLLLDIATHQMGAPFSAGLTEATARNAMIEMYRILPALLASGLGQLCEKIAVGAVPALIHCTAGKDRTGVICASILRLLGVSDRDIYADYMLSDVCNNKPVLADHLGKQLQAVIGEMPNAETVDALVSVSPGYLETAFAAMVDEFGSFDAYLEKGAGIDARLRRKLESVLLEGF